MATTAKVSGRLGFAKPGTGSDDFKFHRALVDQDGVTNLGPLNIRRTYASSYVPVPIPFSDNAPQEWKLNNPGEISCEVVIIGNRKNDVTASLNQLKKFAKKDKSGEPPELIFQVGNDSRFVRIHRIEEVPTLWDVDSAGEIRTKVTIQMHLTRSWT